jgi:hypothetical protein
MNSTTSSLEQTLADRGNEYGDFYYKSITIQALKDILHHTPNWKELPAGMQESLEMIVHKIGRITHGNSSNVDSWHDIQGYAKLVEDRILRDLEQPTIEINTKYLDKEKDILKRIEANLGKEVILDIANLSYFATCKVKLLNLRLDKKQIWVAHLDDLIIKMRGPKEWIYIKDITRVVIEASKEQTNDN